MTTFTTDDREEAYKKIVAKAPNQPGYEDAVPIPTRGMNNEPVAWMQTYEGELNNIAWNKEDLKELSESIDYGYIPLYTHPAKTITDEEIYEIGDDFVDGANDEQGYCEFDRIGFARAILRKAQEK
jgi:hypothetical protein